jgi:hypothetical protein
MLNVLRDEFFRKLYQRNELKNPENIQDLQDCIRDNIDTLLDDNGWLYLFNAIKGWYGVEKNKGEFVVSIEYPPEGIVKKFVEPETFVCFLEAKEKLLNGNTRNNYDIQEVVNKRWIKDSVDISVRNIISISKKIKPKNILLDTLNANDFKTDSVALNPNGFFSVKNTDFWLMCQTDLQLYMNNPKLKKGDVLDLSKYSEEFISINPEFRCLKRKYNQNLVRDFDENLKKIRLYSIFRCSK